MAGKTTILGTAMYVKMLSVNKYKFMLILLLWRAEKCQAVDKVYFHSYIIQAAQFSH